MQKHGERELNYGDYNNGVLGIKIKISVVERCACLPKNIIFLNITNDEPQRK
jgi:hypothetical protein